MASEGTGRSGTSTSSPEVKKEDLHLWASQENNYTCRRHNFVQVFSLFSLPFKKTSSSQLNIVRSFYIISCMSTFFLFVKKFLQSK